MVDQLSRLLDDRRRFEHHRIDGTYAQKLLGVKFDVQMDLGTYFARTTDAGHTWGLPKTFEAPGSFFWSDRRHRAARAE